MAKPYVGPCNTIELPSHTHSVHEMLFQRCIYLQSTHGIQPSELQQPQPRESQLLPFVQLHCCCKLAGRSAKMSAHHAIFKRYHSHVQATCATLVTHTGMIRCAHQLAILVRCVLAWMHALASWPPCRHHIIITLINCVLHIVQATYSMKYCAVICKDTCTSVTAYMGHATNLMSNHALFDRLPR